MSQTLENIDDMTICEAQKFMWNNIIKSTKVNCFWFYLSNTIKRIHALISTLMYGKKYPTHLLIFLI